MYLIHARVAHNQHQCNAQSPRADIQNKAYPLITETIWSAIFQIICDKLNKITDTNEFKLIQGMKLPNFRCDTVGDRFKQVDTGIYIEKGVLAQGNEALVLKVCKIAEKYNRKIASPHEARQILKMKEFNDDEIL
jgi:hypothetical protein